MNKNKIIGNQEEQKGIEKLLRQAGKDKVINEVIEGKDPDAVYQGMAIFNDEELGPCFKAYKTDETDYMRDTLSMHDRSILLKNRWLEKPMTYNEILRKALELWGDEYNWLEDLVKKCSKIDKEKPVIGVYSHAAGGLAEVAKTFEENGIPIELRGCICYRAEHLTKASGNLPKIAIINPSSSIRGCWKGIKEIIEANPKTQFYIPLFGLGPGERKESIGFHLNLTYIHSTHELGETMHKLLRRYKPNQ